MLIAPGSSLGGARPKASVRDEKNNLWIAKFPSNKDKGDVGAWEIVANDLAKLSEINTAESKISKFSSQYHTFLTKRFDRFQSGKRLHFASAMTLLDYTDDHLRNHGFMLTNSGWELSPNAIIENTVEVVNQWKEVAKKYRLSQREIELMGPATL